MDYGRLGAILFLAFNCAACSALGTVRPDISAAPQAPAAEPVMPEAAEPAPPPPIPPQYGPEAAEILTRLPNPAEMIDAGRTMVRHFMDYGTYEYTMDPENARAAYAVYAATGLELMGIGYARLGEALPPQDRALFTQIQRELQSTEHRFYAAVTRAHDDDAALLMFASCTQAVQIDKAVKVLEGHGITVAFDMDYPAQVRARCNAAVSAVVGDDFMETAQKILDARDGIKTRYGARPADAPPLPTRGDYIRTYSFP